MKWIGGSFCMSLLVVPLVVPREAPAQVIFSCDFDAPCANLSGVTSTEAVQGYSGIGGFSGDFLRNTSPGNPASPTIVTLMGLPSHTEIAISFLLAIVDSWDGSTLFPEAGGAPDLFNIRVDGNTVFSETFDNFGQTDQSYTPPDGGLLTSGSQLGFTCCEQFFSDSGYDMGLEPSLASIPHTASTLTIEFFASGMGWLGGEGPNFDESWAIDNLSVSIAIEPSAVPALADGPMVLLVALLVAVGVVALSPQRRRAAARRC